MQWPVPTQLSAMTHVFIAVVREHVLVPAVLHTLPMQRHPQRLLLSTRALIQVAWHRQGWVLHCVCVMGGIVTAG